jgi:hypothetical protein
MARLLVGRLSLDLGMSVMLILDGWDRNVPLSGRQILII